MKNPALVKYEKQGDGCTPFDHVFQGDPVHGALCCCGKREWGVEPKRKEWEFLKKGKVKRTVWKATLSKHTMIYTFRECGHIETRPHRPGMVLKRVRCFMCERTAREVRKDVMKRERKQAKRRAKQQKMMEQLLRRKRIRIKLKRRQED